MREAAHVGHRGGIAGRLIRCSVLRGASGVQEVRGGTNNTCGHGVWASVQALEVLIRGRPPTINQRRVLLGTQLERLPEPRCSVAGGGALEAIGGHSN
eukprot:CAMPEP_0206146818 /NCGR_PEP_ID=MMETSP1473-20131121/31524_1 /ASSEMBLY_ACC=CAM_ASM_001109 /TAXON_ID=1461547 /ORGANISM="Stichococcus sp, Strain RCC1054" /LENGTH=97 /DNA_ID=CAMNT_0053543517 /DNA_START=1331 /DNA_END=1624 /DNA_ORIENTATION=-